LPVAVVETTPTGRLLDAPMDKPVIRHSEVPLSSHTAIF
jgi:hypothetical protein